MTTRAYVKEFKLWMKDWADAFVTVNMPFERSAPKPAEFYLSLWTRVAEAKVLGTRTRRMSTFDRRIVWLFRRELSADGLVHFHGTVRFPENRRWRGEDVTPYTIDKRCEQLESALRAASMTTPEPFRGNRPAPFADIDVRPAHKNHGGYLLKDMYRQSEGGAYFGTEVGHDSGLIVLPHLPPKRTGRAVDTATTTGAP